MYFMNRMILLSFRNRKDYRQYVNFESNDSKLNKREYLVKGSVTFIQNKSLV